jgi:hypothetical protein
MPDIEQRCADVRTRVARLNTDEINTHEFQDFIDATNSLLEDIIAEQRVPVDPKRRQPRWARRIAAPLSKVVPKAETMQQTLKNNEGATKKIINFLVSVQGILGSLKLIAANAPELEGYPKPGELLEKLTSSYDANITPMIQFLEDNTQHIEQVGAIAGLGIAVFMSCRELNKYRDQMTTNEKIYAVVGTVLLFTGVAMLVAATVNPTTMPIVAAITILALGRFLCKRAVQKHQDEASKNLDNSLNVVHDNINKVSDKFSISKVVKDTLMFSAAKACGVKKGAPPAPSIVDRVSAAYQGFINRVF